MPASALIAERYQLLDQLGRGATGQVWRARDLVLERPIAVKIVDLAHQDDPAAEQRFRREAVTMAGVNHPNVVGIFDAGVDDDMAFLVMELLTGPDLRSFSLDASEGADLQRMLPILRQVALGLQAAHRNGVVHRDVKPANVVMDHDTPKIVDFGIATLTNHSATLTAPATAIGTASYMSPEQALGRHVSPASDWYSFGCCLMAVLTGRPPFVADNALAVATAQINERPPLLSDRRPDSPSVLTWLVDELLAKEPADRPAATEVIELLDQAVAAVHFGDTAAEVGQTQRRAARREPTAQTQALEHTESTEWLGGTGPAEAPTIAAPTWYEAPSQTAQLPAYQTEPMSVFPPTAAPYPAPGYEMAPPQGSRRRRRRELAARQPRPPRFRGFGRGLFRGLITGATLMALFYGLGWVLSAIL